MAMVIRPADTTDADAVSSLNADVQAVHAAALPQRFKPPGPETFPPAAAAELLANPANLVLLAEVDFAPVGYAYAEHIRRPESASQYAYEMVYLHHISVRPAHRGGGLGRALMEAVRAAAEERGVSLLALDVWSFNEEARAFFARRGFTPCNERLWSR
jgi:GNAT superfamily N-acetyltransferase